MTSTNKALPHHTRKPPPYVNPSLTPSRTSGIKMILVCCCVSRVVMMIHERTNGIQLSTRTLFYNSENLFSTSNNNSSVVSIPLLVQLMSLLHTSSTILLMFLWWDPYHVSIASPLGERFQWTTMKSLFDFEIIALLRRKQFQLIGSRSLSARQRNHCMKGNNVK